MISLITHGKTCCVAANVDPAAVTKGPLFDDCLARGFTEVLSLHPGAQPPTLHA